MDTFQRAVHKAKRSSFQMWILNKVLHWRIPFNKPHGIDIIRITDDGFEVLIPYKKKNLNHIRGIHACCLATAGEYVVGLSLMRKLGSEKYRLIMERMEVQYKYQAKSSVVAKFGISDADLAAKVTEPLKNEDVVFVNLTSTIHDDKGQLICEAETRWQIKPWDKVRTRL